MVLSFNSVPIYAVVLYCIINAYFNSLTMKLSVVIVVVIAIVSFTDASANGGTCVAHLTSTCNDLGLKICIDLKMTKMVCNTDISRKSHEGEPH